MAKTLKKDLLNNYKEIITSGCRYSQGIRELIEKREKEHAEHWIEGKFACVLLNSLLEVII
jgi:hypothetical protein